MARRIDPCMSSRNGHGSEEWPRFQHESSSCIANDRFVIAIWNHDLKYRIRNASL